MVLTGRGNDAHTASSAQFFSGADAARELRGKGWSLRTIAKSVGVSTASVARALQR
jgi:lambda repressor-like predicted transcriptional regulator